MKIKALKTAVLWLLTFAVFLCLVGCSEPEEDWSDGNSVFTEDFLMPDSSNSLNTAVTDGENSDDEKKQSDKAQTQETFDAINPLTGEGCSADRAQTRPVAIMINNIKDALPQVGISEADIVYEVLAEGGITRLLCVYNDYKNIAEIGSIRSARDYFIDLSDAHGAIYVHAGSSTYARTAIASRGTNNIDGFYMGNFYRSPERRKTMALEHTMVISGKGLSQNIAIKGYETVSDKKQPLAFYSTQITPKGNEAGYIEVPFSLAYKTNPYAVSFFNYNEDTGLYKKGHFGADHIDGDDMSALEFRNVLVLECAQSTIPADALRCIKVDFTGKGKGKFFTAGKEIDIVWKKNSRTEGYTLYESDGNTLLRLNPGKSYIALVPTGTTITTK